MVAQLSSQCETKGRVNRVPHQSWGLRKEQLKQLLLRKDFEVEISGRYIPRPFPLLLKVFLPLSQQIRQAVRRCSQCDRNAPVTSPFAFTLQKPHVKRLASSPPKVQCSELWHVLIVEQLLYTFGTAWSGQRPYRAPYRAPYTGLYVRQSAGQNLGVVSPGVL